MSTDSQPYPCILEQLCTEYRSRRVRAAGVMAPTTDVLYDFIGKAACGMSLF